MNGSAHFRRGKHMNIKITGTGSFIPANRVTNDDLSKIVDTSDEWIKSRTGIEARHISTEDTTTGMSVQAAKRAMEQAGVEPEDLDILIAATISTDKVVPGLACEVQSAIGAKNAFAFDINAACSGFLYGINIASMYLKSGEYKTALVIGTEMLSKMVDWTDRSTCVLFGDGSGAAVIRAEECAENREGILSVIQRSDGAKGDVLRCDNRPVNNFLVKREAGFSYVSMNGQEVYKFAVKTVPEAVKEAAGKAGFALDEVDYFILHQANYRIIEAVAKRLGQPMEKFPTNLQECGNISAASVPILLDEVNRKGLLKPGNKLILAGFGAGLTWGAAAIIW